MELPKQLKNKDFRFIKIIPGTKRPADDDWNLTSNYRYTEQEFKEYLKRAEAFGVACGYGNLAVIDADHEKVAKDVMFKLPKTFTVQTGSGKWHFYFRIPDLDHFIKLDDDPNGEHYGEVQHFTDKGKATQVLAPGSIHPLSTKNSVRKYKVLYDEDIAEISKDQLLSAIKPYMKQKKFKKVSLGNGFETDIMKVAAKISGLDRQGTGLQGSHPVHGSDGGMNFRIDPEENKWHCFTKDCQVITDSGFKPIDKIVPNDIVAGSTSIGYQRVLSTFKRRYSGNFYHLAIDAINHYDISDGHPLKVCRTHYTGKHINYDCCDILWKNIEDIDPKRDFLIVPREFGNLQHISLSKYIVKYSKCNLIELTYDTGLFVGWYLAEGHIIDCVNKKRIQFTLSYDELKYAKQLQHIIKSSFNHHSSIHQYKARGTTLIDCNSTALSNWLLEICKTGSHNKTLGYLINANEDFLRGLLEGYTAGDGYTDNDKVQIKSVSKQLMFDIQSVLYKFGVISRVCYHKGKSPIYTLYYTKQPKRKYLGFVDSDNVYLRIKDIKKYRDTKVVYNLETETGEYRIPFISHNCFRHNTGGDALSLIGVLEGIIKCEDCVPGYFSENPSKFREILKAAPKYGYDELGELGSNNDYQLFRKSGNKGVLDVESIVQYIKSKCEFITVRDCTGRKPHIYVYENGYYKLNGEDYITNLIKQMFEGLAFKSHYKREIMDYLQTENIVERDNIEPPTHLVNLNNGVLNLRTKELIPHDPKYYFLYKVPWNYNSKARCPKIMEYFNSTLQKKYVQFSQELFGYCLYFDYKIAGIFYLYGTGGNGKSVWIHLLEEMLGSNNVSNKSLDSLIRYRFTSALLYGKLANVCGELTSSILKDTDMVKRLSSGDSVQAEFKGKDGFDFKNRAKIITSCNSIPDSTDMTDGWYQRQFVIPFLKKFRGTKKDNVDLKDELTADDDEMEGLLKWAIDGLYRLLQNKRFTYHKDQVERYLMYQQNVAYFIDTYYQKTGDFNQYIPVDEIRGHYESWCKENDIPCASENSLGRELSKRKIPKDRVYDDEKKIYVRRYLERL